jgi:hypothetical protein
MPPNMFIPYRIVELQRRELVTVSHRQRGRLPACRAKPRIATGPSAARANYRPLQGKAAESAALLWVRWVNPHNNAAGH